MDRADAIILGRGFEQRLRIGDAGLDVMIGRDATQEGAFDRIGRIAVFTLPRGAGRHLGIVDHVEQRHLHIDGVPQVRTLGELDAHQQAAVGTAHDAEVARGGDFSGDQILGHRLEVIVNVLALGLETGLMPGRSELAAPADIGQHEGAALFQPQLADRAGIVGRR